jgi:hypothetical protein
MHNQSDSTETLLLDNQQQQEQQPDHVPSTIPVAKKESEEIILLAPDEQQSAQNKQQQQCDDNQNNMNINNNRMVMMQNFNINASSERILVNLKQLLALYARLKRQLMEFTDVKENEQSSYKEKCDEMSSQVRKCSVLTTKTYFLIRNCFWLASQLLSLKLEIESRPSQEDYDEKIQQCNALRSELTTLTEQLSSNEKLLDELRKEAEEERTRYREKSQRCVSECGSQTEDEEEDVSVIEIESTKSAAVKKLEASLGDEKCEKKDEIDHQEATSTIQMPQTDIKPPNLDDEEDEKFNNHPKVLYEEELIIFKEKCKSLSEDNVRLQRELSELRTTFGHFHGNWLHNAALKYLVPIVIVFIAYIFLSLKS